MKSTPMHYGDIEQPCDYKGMGGKPPGSSLQTGGRTPHELMARDPDLPKFISQLKEMKGGRAKSGYLSLRIEIGMAFGVT